MATHAGIGAPVGPTPGFPGAGDPTKQPAGIYTMQWVAAWVVFLTMLALINRTRIGHSAIYHGVILLILVLLAGQYRRFAQIEEPITGVKVA